MPRSTRNDSHAAEDCRDDNCPRFGCRMWRAGYRAGHGAGYAAGFAAGEAQGYAAGYSAGAASVSAEG